MKYRQRYPFFVQDMVPFLVIITYAERKTLKKEHMLKKICGFK